MFPVLLVAEIRKVRAIKMAGYAFGSNPPY
jgi:hypothetical protein